MYFSEIAEAITGFARVVKYKNHTVKPVSKDTDAKESRQMLINPASSSLRIDSFEEGQYENGKKNGFCKVLSASDGSGEVGWFKDGIPWGKYMKYSSGGENILE